VVEYEDTNKWTLLWPVKQEIGELSEEAFIKNTTSFNIRKYKWFMVVICAWYYHPRGPTDSFDLCYTTKLFDINVCQIFNISFPHSQCSLIKNTTLFYVGKYEWRMWYVWFQTFICVVRKLLLIILWMNKPVSSKTFIGLRNSNTGKD